MRRQMVGLAVSAVIVLGGCGGGGGGGTDEVKVDPAKTRTACEALAQEPVDPYNAAVEEWNGHQATNDAIYQRYTIGGRRVAGYIGGGFERWAKDNSKPTQPDPNIGTTDDAADQAAVDAAGDPLASKVKAAQAAASKGDLAGAQKAATEMRLICGAQGVTLS